MKAKEKDYFEALYEVTRLINASLDPGRVLEEIVCAVVSAMDLKAASLRILDARRKKLLLGASCGLSGDYLKKGPILLEASGLDRKVLRGTTCMIRDARTDPDFQYGPKARDEGIASVLVVPLIRDRKALGVLRAYTETVRDFSKREIRFLEAVAHLSAIALDNARLHKALQTRCELMAAHKNRIDDN
jgi:signal transduction protein with GAF and PtsI domain